MKLFLKSILKFLIVFVLVISLPISFFNPIFFIVFFGIVITVFFLLLGSVINQQETKEHNDKKRYDNGFNHNKERGYIYECP